MKAPLAVAIASVFVGTLAMTAAPAGADTAAARDDGSTNAFERTNTVRDARNTDGDTQEQWRSYWVDSFNAGFYTPDEVDTLVADAKEVGANALIIQVGRNMDCFCNDSLFPRTEASALDPEPYDPLQDVLDKAHAEGIEVHAWVNATIFWREDEAPQDSEHIYHSHGPDAPAEDRWINKRHDGTEEIDGFRSFLDPANPAATDYFVDGVASLLENYDIDGVNLDYIRYPDYNAETDRSDWGYSDTSIARFQEATGRSDVPEPDDEQFSDWRRDQVTGFVRKIYLRMFELDPSARLSINAITYGHGPRATDGGFEGTRTYVNVLQDWKSWLQEGIVDTVVTMNYKRQHLDDQRDMFAEWNEFTADNQANRSAATGPGIYLNSVESSLEQAEIALSPTDAGNQVIGWSGYSYATPSMAAADDPSSTDEERQRLADGLTADLFSEPATVPDMPWKSDPSAGHLQSTLTLADGSALDRVRVTVTNTETGQSTSGLTNGNGWVGFVDLEPGRYKLRADLPEGVVGKPNAKAKVDAGGLAEPTFGPLRRP